METRFITLYNSTAFCYTVTMATRSVTL